MIAKRMTLQYNGSNTYTSQNMSPIGISEDHILPRRVCEKVSHRHFEIEGEYVMCAPLEMTNQLHFTRLCDHLLLVSG